jgi:phage gp46-like protein
MTGWIEDDAGLPVSGADGVLLPANCTGDIYILWDNVNAHGDWALADGDLQSGQDLETACLVSLFTDKLATADFVPTDGTTDRRGWWADPYNDAPLGSNLWQLERAHKTRNTLGLAQRYASDALQWMVTDGLAQAVAVDTQWLTPSGAGTFLAIRIVITQPDGSMTRFTYGWAWDNLAVLKLAVQAPPYALPAARAAVGER